MIVERLIENIFDHNAGINPEVKVSCTCENEDLTLSIMNTGSSISEAIISRVFEPFSTSMPGSHLGLGLYVVSSIVKNLFKGEIEIFSGKSSTEIIIRFPCEFK